MPALPPAAARHGTHLKKAARSCQSRELRKVIMVGSRKSLLVLHHPQRLTNLGMQLCTRPHPSKGPAAAQTVTKLAQRQVQGSAPSLNHAHGALQL